MGSASLYAGLAFFAGGSVSNQVTQTRYVDVYRASSNDWIRMPNALGIARFRVAGASLPSGLVFFAAGDTSHSSAGSAHVDMYNSVTGTWFVFSSGLGQARRFLVAVSLPSGLVFFAGGNFGHGMAWFHFQSFQIVSFSHFSCCLFFVNCLFAVLFICTDM